MEPVIYWEKQDPKTKLCALHCLNSLLQGPLITADELCEISLILDSEENMLLNQKGNSGHNGHVLGYGNVSESGDFNLPVLQHALMRRNISCTHFPLNQLSLAMFRENRSVGFIANIQAHWFCVRFLHQQWYILDSLRKGPFSVESGWLHDYVKENLEGGKGDFFLIIPKNGEFPEADPFKYTKLQPHQFFFKLSELDQFDEGNRSFLFKDGDKRPKEVVWPTTGGIRLDQHISVDEPANEDPEYTGSDSIRIAIKLFNNNRITRSFSPNDSLKKLFEWLEANCDLKDHYFYFLIQTLPHRKFIKYSNGSIELLTNESAPRDVSNEKFGKLDFGSHDMFMLRLD